MRRKCLNMALMFAFVICPLLMSAQTKEDLEKLKAERDSLEDVCKKMQKKQKVISDSIEMVRASIREKQETFIFKYKNVDNLVVQPREDAAKLREDVKNLEDSIEILDKVFCELQKKEQNNTYLKDFENEFVAPKREYIEQSYELITNSRLEELRRESNLHGNVKVVKDFLKDLETVKQARDVYYKCLDLLSVRYDKLKIDNAKKVVARKLTLNGVKESKVSVAQKQDWHKTNNLLNAYEDGIVEMKKIIVEDNEAFDKCRRRRLKNRLDGIRDDRLIMPERKQRLETYIYPIPYLKKRYEEYEAGLKEDPMLRNAAIEQEFKVEQ